MIENTGWDYAGLSDSEVQKSRATYGDNRITPPKRIPTWRLYLEKFNDPIIRILLLAAMLSLGIGVVEHEFTETIGILAAILLATGIGFYFELDAKRRFDILNALGEEEPVTVVRAGQVQEVPRSQIVVGDIVILEQGAEVPADGILLQGRHLEVNESSLTGEPSTYKTTDTSNIKADSTYAPNQMLRSSLVMEGNGLMRITAVGNQTEYGRVACEAVKPTEVETPLQKQLNKLAAKISRVSIFISILIFLICTLGGLLNLFSWPPVDAGVSWLEVARLVLRNFMIAVTLIVMAVPEGLPMAITLSLALNMRRMLRTNNLVRNMHASETMGAVTVICTDKTGTLTKNQMSIKNILCPPGKESLLQEGMAMNTTAHIGAGGENIGNSTECALLHYLQDSNVDYEKMRRATPVRQQIPFSAERKWMATMVESAVSGKTIIHVKGAPEVILSMCHLSDNVLLSQLTTWLETCQHSAMRTLAFASLTLSDDENFDIPLEQLLQKEPLEYLGLVAIHDPVREEVPAAVNACHDAGIKIKIVTGDNAATAIEVARRIGLWTEVDTERQTITGTEFAALDDKQALEQVDSIKIMSRARPMDKQRLVELLQQRGEVVAVTGDGTNDAPALNRAEVGLSMGSGTHVAKEASDITLLDNSFGSIASAVEWGRSLYKNIQRFLVYQLIISITALAVSAIGAIWGHEMPLTVTQILWINLIMDTFASLALSTLPPSREVMLEKPRNSNDFIVSRKMLRFILACSALFLILLAGWTWFYAEGGFGNRHNLTVFFTLFVMLQFWNLPNVRSVGIRASAFSHLWQCKGLLFVMAVILAGQIIIVQFGGDVFRTEPLPLHDWLWIIGLSSIVLWAGELIRAIKR